jgi:hypothetical protein
VMQTGTPILPTNTPTTTDLIDNAPSIEPSLLSISQNPSLSPSLGQVTSSPTATEPSPQPSAASPESVSSDVPSSQPTVAESPSTSQPTLPRTISWGTDSSAGVQTRGCGLSAVLVVALTFIVGR